MQLSTVTSCRVFGQASLYACTASLVFLLSSLILPGPQARAGDETPAPAAQPGAPEAQAPAADKKPEGGISVEIPQSPAPRNPLPIGYIREVGDRPRPASRVDVEPLDAGVSGAKMAIDENNAGGQFTGEVYNLDVSTVTSPDKAVEVLQKLYNSGHHFIIVDG